MSITASLALMAFILFVVFGAIFAPVLFFVILPIGLVGGVLLLGYLFYRWLKDLATQEVEELE